MSVLPTILSALHEKLASSPTPQTAREIIAKYLNFFDKETIQDNLWLLTVGTITKDELEQTEKGRDRFNYIYFYEFTKLFFEAIRIDYEHVRKNN